jgi:hypothetical protein
MGQYSPLLQYDRLKNIWKYASHENTETLGTVGTFLITPKKYVSPFLEFDDILKHLKDSTFS